MEIYTAIYESDDNDVLKHLSVINACGISLSRDQAHIVGSFAARKENLDSLNLEDCSIDDGLLGIITQCLKEQIPCMKCPECERAEPEVGGRDDYASACQATSSAGIYHNVKSVTIRKSSDGYGFILTGPKAERPVHEFKPTPKYPGLQYMGSVQEGSNAYIAGLRSGDFITTVGNTDVRQYGHQQLGDTIRACGEPLHIQVVTVIRSYPGDETSWLSSGSSNQQDNVIASGDVVYSKRTALVRREPGRNVGNDQLQGRAAIEPREVMEERKRLLESSINSELALMAMEMGFKLPMIKTVLKRKIRLSDNTYSTPAALLEDLLNPPADLDPDSDYDDVDPVDNVPEASEASKIGTQVKEVNVADNNVSATALCSLLGHRRIDSLSGNLYWKVCKLTVDGYYLVLKNEEDAIKISSLHDEGHFNIKESKLVLKNFRPCAQLAVAAYLGILFDAKSIQHHGYIYAKQDVLPELSKWKPDKISKILLDCTEKNTIEWSLIEISFKNCQVELLDIVVNGHTFTDDYNQILERWRKVSVFGFNVNIHEIFIVREEDNFRKMIEASQRKKIECIIYILDFGSRDSFHEILSLMNNTDLKKVTLTYHSGGGMLSEDKLTAIHMIANDLDIELELTSYFEERDSAWKELKNDFHLKHNRMRVIRNANP